MAESNTNVNLLYPPTAFWKIDREIRETLKVILGQEKSEVFGYYTQSMTKLQQYFSCTPI